MSDLADLRRQLGKRPVRKDDLIQVLGALEQAVDRLERYAKFVDALQERLLIVDDLPVDAPLGALIRRRNGTVGERATLYMGNGAGQPLSKLATPTAV